jgi:hypothetical protein
MNTLRLLQILLVIHLTGLTLMAGTTAVSFAAFRKFSTSGMGDKAAITFYIQKILGLSGLLALGGILLVSSGLGLLYLTHAYGQLWFHLKMGVVVAAVSNGFLFGSRQERKIKQVLAAPDSVLPGQLLRPAANLRIFFAIQMVLFLAVILLAVIKPG